MDEFQRPALRLLLVSGSLSGLTTKGKLLCYCHNLEKLENLKMCVETKINLKQIKKSMTGFQWHIHSSSTMQKNMERLACVAAEESVAYLLTDSSLEIKILDSNMEQLASAMFADVCDNAVGSVIEWSSDPEKELGKMKKLLMAQIKKIDKAIDSLE